MILGKRFRDALCLACELHATQLRKDSDVPYVAHLLGAASIALEHGADEDEAMAALLHDAAEDQGGRETIEMIRTRFGDRVADLVAGCSDNLENTRPPWRLRKEAYLRHLAEGSPSLRLVSASDKLHNARAILRDHHIHGEALWDRFSGGRDGVLWYYGRLVEVFGEGGPKELADELKRVVAELMERVESTKRATVRP